MKIISESIADYICLNYDIEEFEDINELEKVEELVINGLNSSLETASFYPNELSYFKKLKRCTFMNCEITDEIINNINLKELILDNCTCNTNTVLDIEDIYIELSDINLKKVKPQRLTILEDKRIDISDIINNNLKELTLLNCNIINSKLLKELKDCKIELVGCTLDDESVIQLDNIKYNPNRFEKII